jgi:phage repressor protein C with HTH and peptisase S24 domain
MQCNTPAGISAFLGSVLNTGMDEKKTIQDFRRENLHTLLAESGGDVNALAAMVRRDPVRLRQLLGRHKPMGESTAREYEQLCGKPYGWMDQQHIALGGSATGSGSASGLVTAAYPTDSSLTPIFAWEHPDDLPPGEYVMIPRMNVHLSAGGGRDQCDVELVKATPQAFRADWIRRKRLKPAVLACMYASGDSMNPRIYDGDSLVVDTSQTTVQDGGVYALWYDGGERVKRLFRKPGGGLIIRSDNSAQHPDMILTAEESEHVRVIGRVVHVQGDGGL